MSKNIVYQGQSLLDKVIEMTGAVDNAFAMVLLNGLSITDDVILGQELKVSAITNSIVVAEFGAFNKPASAISTADSQSMNPELGIGLMRIGSTFIVR